MRLAFILAAVAALTALLTPVVADDKGTTVELAGLKSTTPADWKAEPPSTKSVVPRLYTFKLARAAGDPDDAELAIFLTPGGGSIEQNVDRHIAKFEAPAGKKAEDIRKQSKVKVGPLDAAYLDIQGTFLKKFPPFDPNAKITRAEDYRELYVVFETKDGLASFVLLGPAKTVEKHKKAFDEWVKNFK
jgi:hypothetical protein